MVYEFKTVRMIPLSTPLFFGWTISLTLQRLYDMNGIFQMLGGKNRILPK
jgi:hypothetical protein